MTSVASTEIKPLLQDLLTGLLNGNRRALARLLTQVENQTDGIDAVMAAIYPRTGHAWVIGITGAPGTGKSSLVNALAGAYRQRDKTVAIVAVDPTSPFTGGAILGDRIRMRDLSGDPGVFIRSMATRGSLGGLARTTRDAVRVLDAAGFDVVLIETVGAGQSEVDIARTAQTTVVVEAPGMGDDVQAIKAGILEIADVLVVNKADRPGVVNTARALRAMLELGHPASRGQMARHHGQLMAVESASDGGGDDDVHSAMWLPPIIQTIASNESGESGKGITELIEAINKHRDYLAQSDHQTTMERQQIEIELYDRLRLALMARLLNDVPAEVFADTIERVLSRQIDPQTAAALILDTHTEKEATPTTPS